jgi:hypothetical protein
MAYISVAMQSTSANMAVETSLATVATKVKMQPQDIADASTTDELPAMDDLMTDSSSDSDDDASECPSDEEAQDVLTIGVPHTSCLMPHEASKVKSFASQIFAGTEWLVIHRLSACCSSHELLGSTCA